MTSRYLTQYLLKHQAAPDDYDAPPDDGSSVPDTVRDRPPQSSTSRFWESYSQPFSDAASRMYHTRQFGPALGELINKRPKTMLGLGALGIGGAMGLTKGVPRWLLGTGLLGVGAGYAYSKRDDIAKWLGSSIGGAAADAMGKRVQDNMPAIRDVVGKELQTSLEKFGPQLGPMLQRYMPDLVKTITPEIMNALRPEVARLIGENTTGFGSLFFKGKSKG